MWKGITGWGGWQGGEGEKEQKEELECDGKKGFLLVWSCIYWELKYNLFIKINPFLLHLMVLLVLFSMQDIMPMTKKIGLFLEQGSICFLCAHVFIAAGGYEWSHYISIHSLL